MKRKLPCGCIKDEHGYVAVCAHHAVEIGDIKPRGLPKRDSIPLIPFYQFLKRQAN